MCSMAHCAYGTLMCSMIHCVLWHIVTDTLTFFCDLQWLWLTHAFYDTLWLWHTHSVFYDTLRQTLMYCDWHSCVLLVTDYDCDTLMMCSVTRCDCDMFSVHSVTRRGCVSYSSFCVTLGCWGLDSCTVWSIVMVCYIFVMRQSPVLCCLLWLYVELMCCMLCQWFCHVIDSKVIRTN